MAWAASGGHLVFAPLSGLAPVLSNRAMLVGAGRERQAIERALARRAIGGQRDARPGRRAGDRQDRAARLRRPAAAAGMRVLRPGDRVGGPDSVRGPARADPPGAGAARGDPGAPGDRAGRRARAAAGPAQERFAVGAATLSLLAAYAEEEPVAVVIDDAHWLDGSSAQALLFAFRRLVADPIAVADRRARGRAVVARRRRPADAAGGGADQRRGGELVRGLTPAAAERSCTERPPAIRSR